MHFTAALHELVPESECPQQQTTAAALYCSSLAVPSHRRRNNKCLEDHQITQNSNTSSAQIPTCIPLLNGSLTVEKKLMSWNYQ